jgi:hypothetical protein
MSSMRPVSLPLLLVTLAFAGCDNLVPERVPEVTVASPPSADSVPPDATPRSEARPAPKPAAPVKPSDSEYYGQIRRALRRLVTAEQAFYAENGTYTEDLERVGFRGDGRTTISFVWLRRDGWIASGAHPALPGRSCVIYVGRVKAAPNSMMYVRGAREGVPTCDDTPLRRGGNGTLAAETPPDTMSALDAVAPMIQMRVDLRNLVLSQNAYLAAQGIYSRRIEPLALQYFWHRGVNVRLLNVEADSWSARATHAARPGKSCVVWYGPVAYKPATYVQRRVPETEGVPVCDD